MQNLTSEVVVRTGGQPIISHETPSFIVPVEGVANLLDQLASEYKPARYQKLERAFDGENHWMSFCAPLADMLAAGGAWLATNKTERAKLKVEI